ncbi:hypothetical protein GYMLUDRAFT_45552 [Collybiopsis luxurians FD-317 M1]|uniref:Unplaced genomic scaffold GYMLUscaffold_39, whole genome shotgun sequence n=1 Tax=Collybiopsis luxurians FD-317 M1 TaxID=944289 RepID=A0A0D0CI77_9AGAR|nr:hypothetical protein GYMLUDRAFT_45552 [Collybiopsis luxurians FD-317 M1]
MYPVYWIGSHTVPTVTSWFNAPAPPHSVLPYWWPGWCYSSYNSIRFIMVGPVAAVQAYT